MFGPFFGGERFYYDQYDPRFSGSRGQVYGRSQEHDRRRAMEAARVAELRRKQLEREMQKQRHAAALQVYTAATVKIQRWYRLHKARKLAQQQDRAARVIVAAMRRRHAQEAARKIIYNVKKLNFLHATILAFVHDSQNDLSNAQTEKVFLSQADKLEKFVIEMDGIPTSGSALLRSKRKDVVSVAQAALQQIDVALEAWRHRRSSAGASPSAGPATGDVVSAVSADEATATVTAPADEADSPVPVLIECVSSATEEAVGEATSSILAAVDAPVAGAAAAAPAPALEPATALASALEEAAAPAPALPEEAAAPPAEEADTQSATPTAQSVSSESDWEEVIAQLAEDGAPEGTTLDHLGAQFEALQHQMRALLEQTQQLAPAADQAVMVARIRAALDASGL